MFPAESLVRHPSAACRAIARALALAALGAALAVPARSLAAQNNNCLAPRAGASTRGPFDQLTGSYMLIMYATAGAQAGRISAGSLELRQPPPDAGAPAAMYVGAATVDMHRLGAKVTGLVLSRDPAAPGVTFDVGDRGEGTLLFGSVRLRDKDGRLTVPLVAATVRELTARGMRGTWRGTGAGAGDAAGYFCAFRY